MSFLQCILFLISIILINCSINDIELTTDQTIADRIAGEIRKLEKQLKIDREKLKQEKQIIKSMKIIDVIQLNVGGEIIMTTRQTLTKIPKSTLSFMFNGRWEHKLQIDQNGNICFDFNPIIFRHLLDQLQILDTNTQIHFYPPFQSSLVEPFKKMISKLGLNQLSSLRKKNIITFNVAGQIITNRRTTFSEISNSTIETIVSPSKMINFNNQSDVFLDYNPKIFEHLINQLRKESFKNISHLGLSSNQERISFETMLIDFSIFPTTIKRSPISLLATVTASNFYSGSGSATSQGDSLVDRTTGSGGLNTGGIAPQYVQLELPGLYNISSIYLQVNQSPSGITRHQLSVGSNLSNLSIVTDMNNYTSSGQWLNLTYSPALTNIRYLRLDTITSPSWVGWTKFIVYDQ